MEVSSQLYTAAAITPGGKTTRYQLYMRLSDC